MYSFVRYQIDGYVILVSVFVVSWNLLELGFFGSGLRLLVVFFWGVTTCKYMEFCDFAVLFFLGGRKMPVQENA